MSYRSSALHLNMQRIIKSRRTWQLPDLRQEKQVAGLYKLQDLCQVMQHSYIPKGQYEKQKFYSQRESEYLSRPDGRISRLYDWNAQCHTQRRKNRLSLNSKKFRLYYNDS